MDQTFEDSLAVREKKYAALKEDIDRRYAHEKKEFRFRVCAAYQTLDIQLEALELMWEGIRMSGKVAAENAHGRNITLITVENREEYDDSVRMVTQVTGFSRLVGDMRKFIRKTHKEDRDILLPQLEKVRILMASLKNVRYQYDGGKTELQVSALAGDAAVFARRIRLTTREEKILRHYGSVRLEEVLRVCESQFSDFSRRENSPPDMSPDRPFFVKPMRFTLEQEILSIWKDFEDLLPYPIPVPIRAVEPISMGNVRKLNEFSGQIDKSASEIFTQLFQGFVKNEFLTKEEDFKVITNVFLEKIPCTEAIMFGLGFSPGFMDHGREEYFIDHVLTPLTMSAQTLTLYFLIGMLLGYDRREHEKVLDTNSIITRLLEFPLKKGAHFLGARGDTLGVIVQ